MAMDHGEIVTAAKAARTQAIAEMFVTISDFFGRVVDKAYLTLFDKRCK